MTGKVIAVANMKGGVGKTTLVVGLAETLAAIAFTGRKLNVLVMDLDAQANASLSLAGEEIVDELVNQERTVECFLKRGVIGDGSVRLVDFIRPQASNLCSGRDLIPLSIVAATPELRYTEREIIYSLTRAGYSLEAIEGRVRELVHREIKALRRQFDVIIFDCPPGISAFTEGVLKASDLVIAPVVPDRLSTYGLMAFCNRVLASPRASRAALRLPYVIANRVTDNKMHRKRLEEMELESVQVDAGFKLYSSRIPQSAALVSAVEYWAQAPTYAGKYGAARVFLERVAAETLEILHANA